MKIAWFTKNIGYTPPTEPEQIEGEELKDETIDELVKEK